MAITFEEALAQAQAEARNSMGAGGFGSGSSSSSSNREQEPQVWFGQRAPASGWTGGDHAAQAPRMETLSLTNAKLNFHSWPPSEQQAWANKMYRAGLINDPLNLDEAMNEWNRAVEFAAGEYTYGHKKITPWDVMQARLGLNKAQGRGGVGGGGSGRPTGPVTTTNTSTAVQVLSNGDADNMIQSIFQQQLGRKADKGELSRYRSMLINKLRDNPRTTKTVQTVDPDGNSTQNSTTSGGVGEGALGDLALNRAQADPEWGAYQAATTYMGALESLLGGGPDLTGSNG